MGVHSVSEEVESIWDAREVALDHEGVLQNTHGIYLNFLITPFEALDQFFVHSTGNWVCFW